MITMNNTDKDLSSRSGASSDDSSTWDENTTINNFGLTLGRLSKRNFNSKYSRRLLSSKSLGALRQTKFSDRNVETIINKIEKQKDLMQDDPVSEMKRLETLREMPQCLTIKRSIKANLTSSINQKIERKVISRWKRFKYSSSMFWMKFISGLRDITSLIELWHNDIKTIEGNFGSGVAAYFKFLRWLFVINVINCILSVIFISIPQNLVNVRENIDFNFWDIFTGNGFMEKTIFYYGSYSNATLENYIGLRYNIPTAYCSTMIFCYAMTYIILSVKVARSYKKCYIETSGGLGNRFASKIFSSWDFSIASSKTASTCSASIYRELKELLADTNHQKNSSCLSKFIRLLMQFLMTLLVMGIIAGTSALLWSLLKLHKPQDTESHSILIAPLVVTGIMNIFPIIISQLVKIERYSSKRKSLYVNVMRFYGFYVVIISTFLIYWLSYSVYNCWQTQLAEEIYRLVIFDFIFTIGNFLIEALRYKLSKYNIGSPKFNIAQNTLNLIYNQILLWAVFYFSPLLSVVVVVKMFLTFYIKKIGLMRHCEPSSTSWRAAQTQTIFLALVFLGMTGVIIALGYVITNVKSNACGPFREHDYTWDAIVEKVLNLKRDSQFWRIITVFTKPGVFAALLIAMSTIVYCLREKAQANKKMVKILREMLVLQSKDKDFLINEFPAVADENWLKRRTKFNETRSSFTNNHRISINPSPKKNYLSQSDGIASPSCSKNYITLRDSQE